VAFREASIEDHAPDPLRQPQEPQRVADGGAALADQLGDLLVGVAVLLDEALVGLGELDGVEVFPLNVLDEGELEGLAGVQLLDDDLDLVEPGFLAGAPAALAGDDLVAIGVGGEAADDDGLDEPPVLDGGGELREALQVEVLARLAALGDNLLDGAGKDGALRGKGGGGGEEFGAVVPGSRASIPLPRAARGGRAMR
jgi:hypothetical protein